MWQNVKYYAVAYAIVVLGVLIATGLQLLEGLFPGIHPLNKLAANLSGISFGTVIMMVGLIRDKRVADAQAEANKQRQRADKAEAAITQVNQKAEAAITQTRRLKPPLHKPTKRRSKPTSRPNRNACEPGRLKPNLPGCGPNMKLKCSPASAVWRNLPV